MTRQLVCSGPMILHGMFLSTFVVAIAAIANGMLVHDLKKDVWIYIGAALIIFSVMIAVGKGPNNVAP